MITKKVLLVLDFDGTMRKLIHDEKHGKSLSRTISDLIDNKLMEVGLDDDADYIDTAKQAIIEVVTREQSNETMIIGDPKAWQAIIRTMLEQGDAVAIISFNKYEYTIRYFLQTQIGLTDSEIAKIIFKAGEPSASEEDKVSNKPIKNRRINAVVKATSAEHVIIADDEIIQLNAASCLGCHTIEAKPTGEHLVGISNALNNITDLPVYREPAGADKENKISFHRSDSMKRIASRDYQSANTPLKKARSSISPAKDDDMDIENVSPNNSNDPATPILHPPQRLFFSSQTPQECPQEMTTPLERRHSCRQLF